jgi:hypothetical protein
MKDLDLFRVQLNELGKRAAAVGGPRFADRICKSIEIFRWIAPGGSGNRRQFGLKPGEVRARVKRVISAGNELLAAVSESSEILLAQLRYFQRVQVGDRFLIEDKQEVLGRIMEDVPVLVAAAAKLHDSQPATNPSDGARLALLHVLRDQFEKNHVPWTATCPVNPDEETVSSSLAVSAVAVAFGTSLTNAGKAIQRMDGSRAKSR